MLIKTYKVIEYRSCKTYFRNFRFCFEYLTIVKGELYTAHITVIPTIFNRIMKWLKIEKSYYSDFQEGKIITQLKLMSQTTIDTVLDKK